VADVTPPSAVPEPLGSRVTGVLDVALHRFLGVELLEPTNPAAGIELPVQDAALNNAGVLHGGIVTALLDVACYLTLLPDLGPDENAVTHDVTVSLMRPVPRGARLQMSGEVLRRGRSIVFLRAEARVDGAVVAAGQVTKTVLRQG
jgi:uncharacterized protein (TIGR00369 family)